MVRRLLVESDALIFNLDMCGYASDLTSIEKVLARLGEKVNMNKFDQVSTTQLRGGAGATYSATAILSHRPGAGTESLIR